MSSAIQKSSKYMRKLSLAGHIAEGVGKNTVAGHILDPAGMSLRAAEQGKGVQEIFDPHHAFHKTPDTSSPEAPPPIADGQEQGVLARARMRRRVYKAQGRSSTIRSKGQAVLASGAQLLGS